MLRYTILLTATLCVALFSEMAANQSLTVRIAGEISPPHASLKADCQACHEPWQGPSGERCLGCHALAVIDRRSLEATAEGAAENPSGQAVGLEDESVQCAECHKEHLGLPKMVKADPSVARVHLLGNPLHGTCRNCHCYVDHNPGKEDVLPCAFRGCHGGEPTKTTKEGSHVGMRAE